MLNVTSTNEEKVPITAAPLTKGGHPAKIDGALKVTVQSGNGTFEQDPATPLSFTVVSGDDPGQTVYLVEADVDLGEGVTNIQDTVTYDVVGAQAQSFGLSAGAAIPK